jgi:hypothetical protein
MPTPIDLMFRTTESKLTPVKVYIIAGPSPSNPAYIVDAYVLDGSGKKTFMSLSIASLIKKAVLAMFPGQEAIEVVFGGDTAVDVQEIK